MTWRIKSKVTLHKNMHVCEYYFIKKVPVGALDIK